MTEDLARNSPWQPRVEPLSKAEGKLSHILETIRRCLSGKSALKNDLKDQGLWVCGLFIIFEQKIHTGSVKPRSNRPICLEHLLDLIRREGNVEVEW